MLDPTTPGYEVITLGETAAVHLPAGLRLRPLAVDASYWRHEAEHPELAGGRTLSVFDYTDTWTWRERHPDGDELVYLMAGRVELELDGRSGSELVALAPGQSAIVPSGTWHRALVPTPSRVLFLTPTPGRTEHRPL